MTFLVFCAFSFCSPHAWADPDRAQPASPALITGLLEDFSGELQIESVAARPASDFTPLAGKPIRKGFIQHPVWVRIELAAPAAHASLEPLWLELSSPLLEQARLYAQADQRWQEVPLTIQNRKPLFQLNSDIHDGRVLFLKIQTRTSMSTEINLWRSNDYLEHESRNTMVWSLMFGSYLTIIFFYFVFWLWSKEKIHLFYAFYVAINFAAAFMTEGWPLMLLARKILPTYINVLGLFLSIVVTVATAFTLEYLEGKRFAPQFSRALLTLAALISLTSITFILMNEYQKSAITSQISSIALIIINVVFALYLLKRNRSKALFFLTAFTPFYIGVVWRYLRNIDLIEPSFWNDNAYQFGALFHMALMSIGIFASYNRMRVERNQAQALAQAESALREQQNDFMAMVSHETRTPLSVILASSENLQLDSGLTPKSQQRVQKIANAAQRIQGLLTRFIERERHFNAHQGFSPDWHDLRSIACAQAEETNALHDCPILVELPPDPVEFRFDAELTRIAIANLLENAIHYSQDSTPVQLTVTCDTHHVRITVSDTGPGIPESDLPHILSRYYRGKNSKGYGLGLYLVHQIARKHGGELNIHNRPKEGCDVMLVLPFTA